MSPLPQRKKSPEEIARLRETLGIPGSAPQVMEIDEQGVPPVDTIVPANHEATVVHTAEAAALPKPAAQPVHSLKRSERGNVPETMDPAPVLPPAREAKPVRSLRKSEQLPAASHPESPPDSNLPHLRHSDREIAEIRRREALALMNARPNPKLFPAHPALIIPGYLSAIAGAVGFYFYQFPIAATLAFATVSLVVATIIGIRKPISRHHAAFIAVMALFVLVFGALHYFPHLRHAT
ncbi:MAG: hypothetical protein EHM17_09200 [Verrucomicrobiaceae bacterium]|nr:MAG: hypothetical protein EHM17_09200 [Verrucomicrobiaceae bacterium]